MKYKVGDRVKMHSLQWCKENIFNNEDKYPPELFRGIEKFCGKILTVSDAVDKSKYVDEGYYNMDEDTEWDYYWTDEMIEGLVEEEEIEFTEEDKYWCDIMSESDPTTCVLPQGYQFKDENGNVINATKIVLEKKKKEYPKTYCECKDILGLWDIDDTERGFYKTDLIDKLQMLLICRDAYWKIAGDEMGLGKPWEPDWTTDDVKHSLVNVSNTMIPSVECKVCRILVFPTKEMRDAFKENFKELIEQCKELL